jgi:hypothetical protein
MDDNQLLVGLLVLVQQLCTALAKLEEERTEKNAVELLQILRVAEVLLAKAESPFLPELQAVLEAARIAAASTDWD